MARNRQVNESMRRAMRRKLTDAAVSLFAEKGFHAVSPKDITRAAGVSSGIFYHYFPNKQALAAAIIKQMGEDLACHIDPYFVRAGTLEAACRAGFTSLFDFLEANKKRFSLFLFERSNEELRPVIDRVVLRLLKDSRRRIRQGRKAGVIRKDVNLEVMARLINEMGFEAVRLYLKEGLPRKTILDSLTRFVAAGLGRRD